MFKQGDFLTNLKNINPPLGSWVHLFNKAGLNYLPFGNTEMRTGLDTCLHGLCYQTFAAIIG